MLAFGAVDKAWERVCEVGRRARLALAVKGSIAGRKQLMADVREVVQWYNDDKSSSSCTIHFVIEGGKIGAVKIHLAVYILRPTQKERAFSGPCVQHLTSFLGADFGSGRPSKRATVSGYLQPFVQRGTDCRRRPHLAKERYIYAVAAYCMSADRGKWHFHPMERRHLLARNKPERPESSATISCHRFHI